VTDEQPSIEEDAATVKNDLLQYQGLADYEYGQVHGYAALARIVARVESLEAEVERITDPTGTTE
jgi:hypothetical protein